MLGSADRLSVSASIVRASHRSSMSRARSSRNGSRVIDAAVRVTSRATLESAWATPDPSAASSVARSPEAHVVEDLAVRRQETALRAPRPIACARSRSPRMAFSATSKAPRERRTSGAASRGAGPSVRSVGRLGGRRSAATAPRARPTTTGRPARVTFRVPPPVASGAALASLVDELGVADSRPR